MPSFDIEKARAGARVQTRDGRPVKILTFDVKSVYCIVAIVTNPDGSEITYTFTKSGEQYSSYESDIDLVMACKRVWLLNYQVRSGVQPCAYLRWFVEEHTSEQAAEDRIRDLNEYSQQTAVITKVEYETT